jgi:hypothetical protein
MRTLMKVKIPTAAGNEAIKNGSLPEIVGKALASLNAEAALLHLGGRHAHCSDLLRYDGLQ